MFIHEPLELLTNHWFTSINIELVAHDLWDQLPLSFFKKNEKVNNENFQILNDERNNNCAQLNYVFHIFSCLNKIVIQFYKSISMNNASKMTQDWLKSTRGLLKSLTDKQTAYVLQYLLGQVFQSVLICISSLFGKIVLFCMCLALV